MYIFIEYFVDWLHIWRAEHLTLWTNEKVKSIFAFPRLFTRNIVEKYIFYDKVIVFYLVCVRYCIYYTFIHNAHSKLW